MVNYDLILLDNDNTLFDSDRAQKQSLISTFQHYQLDCDDGVLKIYRNISKSLWDAYEAGQLEKSRLGTLRFQKIFKHLGLSLDPGEFNRVYWDYLGRCDCLLEGAEQVCAKLSKHCTLAVATNGFSALQRSHVENTPLGKYISHIIVSDEIGIQKPNRLFFDRALELCGFSDRSRVLMVGDSFSADIKGAQNAGVSSCWYNPRGNQHLVDSVPADYEIRSLYELIDIIL